MRRGIFAIVAGLLLVSPLRALDGQPGMHDPSTVIAHDGRFYVYATGAGLPMAISDDGWPSPLDNRWRGVIRCGFTWPAAPGRVSGAVLARRFCRWTAMQL